MNTRLASRLKGKKKIYFILFLLRIIESAAIV
jgi:hypothetical protein